MGTRADQVASPFDTTSGTRTLPTMARLLGTASGVIRKSRVIAPDVGEAAPICLGVEPVPGVVTEQFADDDDGERNGDEADNNASEHRRRHCHGRRQLIIR